MIGPTCPACLSIHAAGEVVAIGRFSPTGPSGYRAKVGGQLWATREEAAAAICATTDQRATGREREQG